MQTKVLGSGNPAVEPYLDCAICILDPPKIQTLSPSLIFSIPVYVVQLHYYLI